MVEQLIFFSRCSLLRFLQVKETNFFHDQKTSYRLTYKITLNQPAREIKALGSVSAVIYTFNSQKKGNDKIIAHDQICHWVFFLCAKSRTNYLCLQMARTDMNRKIKFWCVPISRNHLISFSSVALNKINFMFEEDTLSNTFSVLAITRQNTHDNASLRNIFKQSLTKFLRFPNLR